MEMRVASAHSSDHTMLLEHHIPILPGMEGVEIRATCSCSATLSRVPVVFPGD